MRSTHTTRTSKLSGETMQDLPHRREETRNHYPPPWKPIERISEEDLYRAAKAMREAWPELSDNAG
jgi:hypothetical protein